MSDITPSIVDDFDVDPTADFLAREQALLGDDAALFGNPLVSNAPETPLAPSVSGGNADDLLFSVPTADIPAVPVPGAPLAPVDDFFGNAVAVQPGSVEPQPSSASGFGFFESTSAATPSSGIVMGGLESPAKLIKEETDAIKEWKISFQAKIEERDTQEKIKHESILKDASEALEKFYAEYQEKKKKGMAKNKEHEKTMYADDSNDPLWTRVLKQVDASKKKTKKEEVTKKNASGNASSSSSTAANKEPEKDLSRFKSLLLSLKNDPKAPPFV